jgi:hypothetical protein
VIEGLIVGTAADLWGDIRTRARSASLRRRRAIPQAQVYGRGRRRSTRQHADSASDRRRTRRRGHLVRGEPVRCDRGRANHDHKARYHLLHRRAAGTAPTDAAFAALQHTGRLTLRPKQGSRARPTTGRTYQSAERARPSRTLGTSSR